MLGQLSVIANAVLRELSGYNAKQNMKARYKNSTKEEIKVEEIKYELLEREKLINTLQAQLHQAQSEQAMKVGVSHLIIVSLTNHYQPMDIHRKCFFLDNQ
ncbi:hypothetical protein LEMLEM_LOCUS892 [Lemmus lemmus]